MTTIHFGTCCLHVTPETTSGNVYTLEQLEKVLEAAPHRLQHHAVIQASLDEVVQVILKTHTLIEAAGGLVANREGDLLMIFRRGYWDLPKGKVEAGEGLEAGALREVEEETGVQQLRVIRQLADTYHTYFMYGQYVLKRTAWYEMAVEGIPRLVAQEEEDITAVQWVKQQEIPAILEQTYPNIQTLLRERYNL